MNKQALPTLTDDLAPRRRVDLKAIKPVEMDDAAVAENSRKIGTEWGAQTSLSAVPTSLPPAPQPDKPKVPLASLRIEIPDYLDRELAFKAVELRCTKQ